MLLSNNSSFVARCVCVNFIFNALTFFPFTLIRFIPFYTLDWAAAVVASVFEFKSNVSII